MKSTSEMFLEFNPGLSGFHPLLGASVIVGFIDRNTKLSFTLFINPN